jgi:hypothetical protein
MKTTYRITSSLLLGNCEQLLSAVFPSWSGEPMSSSQYEIIVTFKTAQTPVDLGPLVKVEIIPTTK